MQETKPLNLDRASERLSLDGVEGTTTLKTFHGEYPLIKKKESKVQHPVPRLISCEKGVLPSQTQIHSPANKMASHLT